MTAAVLTGNLLGCTSFGFGTSKTALPAAGAGPLGAGPLGAGHAVLYEEDLTSEGRQSSGQVVWRADMPAPDSGKSPLPAVAADIDIPSRGMNVTWKLRRDAVPGSAASHIVEIAFTLPPDFSGGGVLKVPGVWMKQDEHARGVALAGSSVKVTADRFMIALSGTPANKARNIQELKERPWIEIPIVYGNNRRAILAVEKGPEGEQAFAEAFAAWEQ